jgi:PAS domain S-box-containing protein
MDDVDRKIAELKELLRVRDRALERRKIHQPPEDLLERLLWQSGQHYKTLLEAVPIPVVFYDSQGAALFINQAFTDTYGFTSEQVLGKMIDFVPEEEKEPTRKAWQRTLDGENVQFTTRRYTWDRQLRVIEMHTAIIEDQAGGHLASVVLHKDITESKQAEQGRLDKEKLKAAIETTGAVCHEVSQPLQVIQSTAELMAMGVDVPEDQYLERIQVLCEHTERLGEILRKLNMIMDFKTKPYTEQSYILDLDRSAGGDDFSGLGAEHRSAF